MVGFDLKNEVFDLFEDKNPTHYLDLSLTKDGTHLLINSTTKEDTELFIMKRDFGEKPVKLLPRQDGVKVYADHVRDGWVFITNDDERMNYKLCFVQDQFAGLGKDKWEDLFRLEPHQVITEFDTFKDFLAVYAKNVGKQYVLVYDFANKKLEEVHVADGEIGEIYPGANLRYDT